MWSNPFFVCSCSIFTAVLSTGMPDVYYEWMLLCACHCGVKKHLQLTENTTINEKQNCAGGFLNCQLYTVKTFPQRYFCHIYLCSGFINLHVLPLAVCHLSCWFFPLFPVVLCRSAVKALRPGGSLVYSTCTLSRAENSDVINLILSSHRNVMPVDISGMARGVSQEFTFLSGMQQHELLVLPEKGRAWGPMYVAKLKKLSSAWGLLVVYNLYDKLIMI